MFRKLKEKAKTLKREIVPIYYALFNKRTPLAAKLLAAVTVAYLLSPIDLIPDFIPVLGLLDDIILVPLLIKATLRLIPKAVVDDIKATTNADQKLKQHWYYAVPIIVLYLYIVYRIVRYIWHWPGAVKPY